ncbi:MAG TPA: hypothetical protein VL382_11290, partial [Terriglobales bacterium]|nr:hypothetical protein [Terriglobales bacterium]
LGSVVWAIARVGDGTNGGVPAPAFIASLADTIVIASVRPLLGAQLRIEAIAGDGEQAKSIVDTGGTMLALFKDLEANSSPSGSDEDVKNLFASIKVEQHDSSAVLSATIPPGFFKKVTNEPPPLRTATPTPSPSPTPAPPKKKKK